MKCIKKARNYLASVKKAAFSVNKSACARLAIFLDILYCRLLFHVTLKEYLNYQFYNYKNRYRKNFLLRHHQRNQYRRVNNVLVTVDKYNFYSKLSDLFEREIILVPKQGEKEFLNFVQKHNTVILKPNRGSCGRDIRIVKYENDEQVLQIFRQLKEETVCEEIIHQHEVLNKFNPNSVNTIRVVSIRHDEQNVEIVSATLKYGTQNGSIVDNLSDTGIVALIDVETGLVVSFGFDLNRNRYTHHPITGEQIIGLRIPNWNIVVNLVKESHSRLEENPVVGFDIAVTERGADIVEGNSAPGPNIMQIMDLVPRGEKILPILNDKKRQKYQLF